MTKKVPKPSWRRVLLEIKGTIDGERWRLSVLMELAQWKSFVTAWMSTAVDLPTAAAAAAIYTEPGQNTEAKLSWCWDQVGDRVDAVLAVMDARSSLSALVIDQYFRTLMGAGLIFPDGTVAKPLLDKLENEMRVAEPPKAADNVPSPAPSGSAK